MDPFQHIDGYINEIKSGVDITTFWIRHGFDNDAIDVDRNPATINLTETSDPRISSVASTSPTGIKTDMVTEPTSKQVDIQINGEIKPSTTIDSLDPTISQVCVENVNISSFATSPRVDMNTTMVSETTSKQNDINKEDTKKESHHISGTSDTDKSPVC